MPRRWPWPYARNAALAAGLAAASQVIIGGMYGNGAVSQKMAKAYFGGSAGMHDALVNWWLFGGLIIAGLLIQHRWPVVALVLASVGAVQHQLDARFGVQPLDFGVPIVLYAVASLAGSRWVPAIALATLSVVDYVINLRGEVVVKSVPAAPDSSVTSALVTSGQRSLQVILVLVLAVMIGHGQRQRAALAATNERARISRELHDVIAHSLSVIVAQAQGAAAALEKHPARAATALRNVIDTGRSSLAEMRRLLGVLRQDPALVEQPMVPPPGVAALPALIDQACSSGLRARVRVEGEQVPLPADVDLTVYRIAQEALTNALRHAGAGTAVAVRLAFAAGTVEVEVTDDGPGGPAQLDGTGHGLRGIVERVGSLGGEVSIGPPAGGRGFRVHTRLPVGARV